jgi:molecular chaperone GrpE
MEQHTPNPAESESSAAGAVAEPLEEATSAEAPVETPADPLAEAQAEALKWKDMAYRNAAELDNFRKRMARETQEARTYANADLFRSLFPILDSFEMGLEAARAESEKSMIFMGMNMVQKQMQEFIKDFGVQEVTPVGQTFDPNLHDAVSQEAHPEIAEGLVLRVMRKGYMLKDRLLRPATVVVSSGPAAA